MSETSETARDFVGYEYREFQVNRKMETVIVDGYANFGWMLEGIFGTVKSYHSEIIRFKRDRKLRNKMELTRLQRQFDASISEIESLERSKVLIPSAVAYLMGVIGTACMAGSVFSYMGGTLPLCIILAVPGFAGWILPYFCFAVMVKKKTTEIDPMIEEAYDEIYETCKKASALLAQ